MTGPETIYLAAFVAAMVVTGLVVRYVVRNNAARELDASLGRQLEMAGAEKRLLEERLDVRVGVAERAEAEVLAIRRELRELSELHQVATAEAVHLGTENSQLAEALERSREEAVRDSTNAARAQLELTEIKTRLVETEKAFREKEAMFRETGDALKKEFQLLANQIFEQQGERFQTRNVEQLNNVLNPFKEQISDFKRKVEEVYTTDAKDRASILTEVRNLQQASERVNQEAENLTRALKGDKRIQGNWGELVLERVLEDSGLRKDHEYYVQTSYRNEDGDLRRPDVIIRLPDEKDVVVDSKVSLTAYERALTAEAEDVRDASLKEHVLNVRRHVKRLSAQSYDQLDGIRSLDFVLMFIPVEAAFTLAMERDPQIFTEAFEKRLVIVSPTTLMMTLRIIDNVWRYEKQNANAQEIAQRAGALYDKVRVILEDMDQLGRHLSTASRSFDTAYSRLATGRGNLVRQVEQFRELGANVKKLLPRTAVDAADNDSS